TFADKQADNPPHGIRANIDDRLRLDLAGSRDYGGNILLIDLACLDSHNVLLALVDREANNRTQQYDDPDDNGNFLCIHELNLPAHTTANYAHLIYAGRKGKVPSQRAEALHEGVEFKGGQVPI